MLTIIDIRDLDQEAAEKLSACGIKTVGELWARPDSKIAEQVRATARDARVPPALICALLIADALEEIRESQEAKPFGLWLGVKPLWRALASIANSSKRVFESRRQHWQSFKGIWLGAKLLWIVPKRTRVSLSHLWQQKERHWPDGLTIVLLLIFIGLIPRALLARRNLAPQVVVKDSTKLYAFRRIAPDDLTLVNAPAQAGTFSSTEALKERYPAQSIIGGQNVQEKQLLAPAISMRMQGRSLLTLPVKQGAISPSLPAPSDVWLFFPSIEREGKAVGPQVVGDVILLSREQQGDKTMVVVALTPDGLVAMKDLLGQSEVFIIQPAE